MKKFLHLFWTSSLLGVTVAAVFGGTMFAAPFLGFLLSAPPAVSQDTKPPKATVVGKFEPRPFTIQRVVDQENNVVCYVAVSDGGMESRNVAMHCFEIQRYGEWLLYTGETPQVGPDTNPFVPNGEAYLPLDTKK